MRKKHSRHPWRKSDEKPKRMDAINMVEAELISSAAHKINVAFATDDNYAQHAAVAMASILMHTKTPQDVLFHVIGDGIAAESKAKIKETVKGFESDMLFYEPSLENDFYVSAGLSRAAYFRLYVAEILPETVSRLIYLDCDLVVLGDIAELFTHDFEGHPMGATMDFGIMASSKRRKEKEEVIGLPNDAPYFNSGVLLMDLAQWREKRLGDLLIKDAAEHHYPHHDQDAMNKMFMGDWSVVPLRWDVIPPVYQMQLKVVLSSKYRKIAAEARKNPAILHYAGGYKPWEYEKREGFNVEYYDALAHTSFRDAPMPQPNESKTNHSLSRQMLRIKVGSFLSKLFS